MGVSGGFARTPEVNCRAYVEGFEPAAVVVADVVDERAAVQYAVARRLAARARVSAQAAEVCDRFKRDPA